MTRATVAAMCADYHPVTPATVPGGHFVPEESPGELLDLLVPFLTQSGQQPSTSGRCTGDTASVTASTPER